MKLITIALSSILLLSACATPHQQQAATRGAAVGAVAGAVIGAPENRAVEGAVVGSMVGAAAGAILAQPQATAPYRGHYVTDEEYEYNERNHHRKHYDD